MLGALRSFALAHVNAYNDYYIVIGVIIAITVAGKLQQEAMKAATQLRSA